MQPNETKRLTISIILSMKQPLNVVHSYELAKWFIHIKYDK